MSDCKRKRLARKRVREMRRGLKRIRENHKVRDYLLFRILLLQRDSATYTVPPEQVKTLVSENLKTNAELFDGLVDLKRRGLIDYETEFLSVNDVYCASPFSIRITPDGMDYFDDMIRSEKQRQRQIFIDILIGVIAAAVGSLLTMNFCS